MRQVLWIVSFAALVAALRPVGAQDATALRAQFDALVDAEYKANEPGGVILVARKGEILYERAFGLANVELSVPMSKDAVFSIASITKQFIAVAVLQQVEKGTIALADTVGKYVPDFPAAMKGVTIEQLLTHTAGIPNAKSVASLLAVGRGWLSAEQVMATFKDQPLDFPPGTRWAYSNSGYQLLGYVLEKVTSEPLPELIEKTILEPAGMEHSLWGNDMKIVPNRASPYLYTRFGIENAVNPNVQIAWAAGALQSTAEDFLKWHRALVSEVFVKKGTLQKAWTPARLKDGSPTDYGYGWEVGELQGSPVVEHAGNMGGFMSDALYLPREDILVVAFLNSRGKRLPELVTIDLATMAIGKPLSLKAVALDDALLRSYTGEYRDTRPEPVTITLENGTLFYQRAGSQKLRVTVYAKDRLYFDNTAIVGEVRRDAQGNVVSVAMQTLRGTSRSVLSRAR